MLILTRRVGEVIVIGDDVLVTVLAVTGRHVRIGIKAPSNVSVHRQEVYERIKNEKADGQTCIPHDTNGMTKTEGGASSAIGA